MPEESFNEKDDERWNEFKWEQFLKESDERAERFARIIEKYGNDPNLESMLANELGLNHHGAPEPGESDSLFGDSEDHDGEDWKEAAGIDSHAGSEENGAGSPENDHFPREDNLYKKAYSLAINTLEWFRQIPEDVRSDPDAADIATRASIPAAKIVSAWDDENDDRGVMGFRIAVYKRGLTETNKALESMKRLSEKNLVEKQALVELIRQATEVRNGIAIRILEVRERMSNG